MLARTKGIGKGLSLVEYCTLACNQLITHLLNMYLSKQPFIVAIYVYVDKIPLLKKSMVNLFIDDTGLLLDNAVEPFSSNSYEHSHIRNL